MLFYAYFGLLSFFYKYSLSLQDGSSVFTFDGFVTKPPHFGQAVWIVGKPFPTRIPCELLHRPSGEPRFDGPSLLLTVLLSASAAPQKIPELSLRD